MVTLRSQQEILSRLLRRTRHGDRIQMGSLTDPSMTMQSKRHQLLIGLVLATSIVPPHHRDLPDGLSKR